jgi:hypothetical protein
VALSGFVSRRGRVRYLQRVNVHRVRCIPPTSRWFPLGTPVSSTIKIQTVCICPREPLGRLAIMLKVSPSLNKVDYYYYGTWAYFTGSQCYVYITLVMYIDTLTVCSETFTMSMEAYTMGMVNIALVMVKVSLDMGRGSQMVNHQWPW